MQLQPIAPAVVICCHTGHDPAAGANDQIAAVQSDTAVVVLVLGQIGLDAAVALDQNGATLVIDMAVVEEIAVDAQNRAFLYRDGLAGADPDVAVQIQQLTLLHGVVGVDRVIRSCGADIHPPIGIPAIPEIQLDPVALAVHIQDSVLAS